MAQERKINPVYEVLLNKVKEQDNNLHEQFKVDPTNLNQRNRGVRCFMKRTDLFESKEDFEQVRNRNRCNFTSTPIVLSNCSAVDKALQGNNNNDLETMTVIYTPHTNPISDLYRGIPCEITDLGITSSFLWHLKAPSLRLKEDEKEFVKLYSGASMYFPNIQVTHANFGQAWKELEKPRNLCLTLMSSVECVVSHLEKQESQDIDLPSIIHNKISTAFQMALKQNVNRAKLVDENLPKIKRIVLGDLGFGSNQPGINSLFCSTLLRVVEQYSGCFEQVVVCTGSFATQMHLLTNLGLDV